VRWIWLAVAIALAAPATAMAAGRATKAKVKARARATATTTDARLGKAMRAHAPQLQQCYEQQLTQNPRLEGRVHLTFVAEPDGSVSSARVDEEQTTLRSNELHRCLLTTVETWRLPKHRGTGVTVSLPVVFTQVD
jgi:TonB family protein